MKGVVALVLLTVCAASSEGARFGYWFPNVVKYTIKNVLREPNFELTETFLTRRPEPFIWTMERAANRSSSFRFSADYFNKELGYFITTINKVRGTYDVDKTFWEFLRAPNERLPLGVSNYVPRWREHIIFNFTMGGHDES